jgi:hypothetical protein
VKNLFIVSFLSLFLISCQLQNNDPAIGQGYITTEVGGVDVKQVNLWSSTKPDRKVLASLPNGSIVDILSSGNEYYYVRNALNRRQYGFCMKEFVAGVQLNK